MKFSNKISNDNSDEEAEEEVEEEEEEDEEQSQDDGEAENNDEEEEDEGDEVEDDEDFAENDENVAPNAISKPVSSVSKQSLGGGNKKIILSKPSNGKKTNTHKLVDEAIQQLNERGGSSSEAIKKFIRNKYPDMDEKRLKHNIKRYLKNCLEDGTMVQIKRSFKLTKKHEMNKKKNDAAKIQAKKEKEKERAKLKKEKEKEKKAEKVKDEKKKISKKEKPTEKSKGETKAAKRANPNAADKAKAKPAKKTKLDKDGKSAADKSEQNPKTEKSKVKKKLGRKSINLVVRPTPPRPKTMKKTKSTTVAGKKKIDFPAADSNAPATAVKATGKGKKK